MRPGALPEKTSETVVCETPARLATSTLVTLRERWDGVRVTGRELRASRGMRGISAGAASTCCPRIWRWGVIRSTVVRMTPLPLLRSSGMLARSALLALLLAGFAGTALSQDHAPQAAA